MKGAQKYRRPASAHSRVMQPQHQGQHAAPSHAYLTHNTAVLTNSSHTQQIPRPPSHPNLASNMQHTAHSHFPSAPQSHTSHGHHSQHAAMPAPDALTLLDSSAAPSHHQQLRKLYYDVQRGQSMLQQEQQESERLRRTVRERDDAVHDARSHARSATRQLVRALAPNAAAPLKSMPIPPDPGWHLRAPGVTGGHRPQPSSDLHCRRSQCRHRCLCVQHEQQSTATSVCKCSSM